MALSLGSACLAHALAIGATQAEHSWPSDKYRDDPVRFFRDVLGVRPWKRQIDIIEAVRDHSRVAVSAGRKVSKSNTAAGIALWYWCSYEDAIVVMSSTTARQVDEILWTELRKMFYRAGRCLDCKEADERKQKAGEQPGPVPCPHSHEIDGQIGNIARTGLKAGFRKISGFTARESEAVAGQSGNRLMYILDEASGIADPIFEAIEGNRASANSKLLLFSNPTRTSGEFFDAFNDPKKSSFYKTLTISSEESPNVVEGREVFPGLASRSWIETMKEMWGEESSLYKIHVKGEFVLNDEGHILSIDDIYQSQQRWYEAKEEGRLTVGIDPAGSSGTGDESAFAFRRGLKIIALVAFRGLTEEGHLANLRGLLKEHSREGDETPYVNIDREGPIGGGVWTHLRNHALDHPHEFRVFGLRASEAPSRMGQYYHLMRDALWANLAEWVKREGGAIIPDAKLQKELHVPEWDDRRLDGKRKVTSKDDFRKVLGRSPDRADAVALSVWTPIDYEERAQSALPTQGQGGGEERIPVMDPYAAMDAWRSR